MNNLIQIIYFVTAFFLIVGMRKMSSPKTANSGINMAGISMAVAILATFFTPNLQGIDNYSLMIIAIIIGSALALYSGKKVKMIHMPQMIALYNGMGGGAAAAIAAIELLRYSNAPLFIRITAIIGAAIGTISFTGSLIAFAKLQEIMKGIFVLPMQQFINLGIVVAVISFSVLLLQDPSSIIALVLIFVLLCVLGVFFTLPIGGANMPIVISLFNAMTGVAVGINGVFLDNAALMIAGTVVGASGILLTQLMAKAMNKSIASILFSSLKKSKAGEATAAAAHLQTIEPNDAAILLSYANKVIIAPGYGMAVAQAQHEIWELAQLLEKKGVTVKFAIHPVAGRMPGHMNVLLAEAGVPYDKIYDLEEINSEFANADVALVIGANDVVNPSANNDPSSPIYGMPILNVALAKNVLVIKRGQGKGFSGVENSLFSQDNTQMLYGDGHEVVNKLIQAIRNS